MHLPSRPRRIAQMISPQELGHRFPPGAKVLVISGEFEGWTGTIDKYSEQLSNDKLPVLFPLKHCYKNSNPNPICRWIRYQNLKNVSSPNPSNFHNSRPTDECNGNSSEISSHLNGSYQTSHLPTRRESTDLLGQGNFAIQETFFRFW